MRILTIQTTGLFTQFDPITSAKMIRNAGFDGVDWNLDQSMPDKKLKEAIFPEEVIWEKSFEEIKAYYGKELDAMQQYGLKPYQAHSPYPVYVKNHPEVFSRMVDVTKKCIQFCDMMGIPILVVHGISLTFDDDTQTPQTVREMNLSLYESLIPTLLKTNVTVCLENLFTRYDERKLIVEGVCSDPNEAVWYIDRLNAKAGKKCFGACVDTGHLNILGKNPRTYINILGDRVMATHLHDNNGSDDSHLAPYTGNIIWRNVIQGLKETGYKGTLSFETFKQIQFSRTDPRMVGAWLKLIHDIGVEFSEMMDEQ